MVVCTYELVAAESGAAVVVRTQKSFALKILASENQAAEQLAGEEQSSEHSSVFCGGRRTLRRSKPRKRRKI